MPLGIPIRCRQRGGLCVTRNGIRITKQEVASVATRISVCGLRRSLADVMQRLHALTTPPASRQTTFQRYGCKVEP
jgi:hypothetical protein